MHTLNILSLNVNGLNSAVKRTRVLEYLSPHSKYHWVQRERERKGILLWNEQREFSFLGEVNQRFLPQIWCVCVLCTGWQPNLLKFKENVCVCVCVCVCVYHPWTGPQADDRVSRWTRGQAGVCHNIQTLSCPTETNYSAWQHVSCLSLIFSFSQNAPNTSTGQRLTEGGKKSLMTACFICLFSSVSLSIQHCQIPEPSWQDWAKFRGYKLTFPECEFSMKCQKEELDDIHQIFFLDKSNTILRYSL